MPTHNRVPLWFSGEMTASRSYQVIVSTVLAVVLLAAGLLKLQALPSTLLDPGGDHSPWIVLPAVQLEFLLGLWLLSGADPVHARRLTMGCFALFFCVSLFKGWQGAESCGCLGDFKISPWWMAILDAVALLALWSWRPTDRGTDLSTAGKISLCAAVLASISLVMFSAFTLPPQPADFSEDGLLLTDSDTVWLEPEAWVGRRFPLMRYCTLGESLSLGSWQVLLYRHDCTLCQEELTHNRTSPINHSWHRQAVLELPPFGRAEGTQEATGWIWGRLDNSRRWLVRTPVMLWLEEGQVVRVQQGPESVRSTR